MQFADNSRDLVQQPQRIASAGSIQGHRCVGKQQWVTQDLYWLSILYSAFCQRQNRENCIQLNPIPNKQVIDSWLFIFIPNSLCITNPKFDLLSRYLKRTL